MKRKLRLNFVLLILFMITFALTSFIGMKSSVIKVSGMANDKGLQHEIALKNEDVFEYMYRVNFTELEELSFQANGHGVLDVTVLNSFRNEVDCSVLERENGIVTLLFDDKIQNGESIYIQIKNVGDQAIRLSSIENPEYLNGDKEAQRYLLSTEILGSNKAIYKTIYCVGMMINLVILIALIVLNRQNVAYLAMKNKFLIILKRFKLTYIIETLLSCFVGLGVINIFIDITYLSEIHLLMNYFVLIIMVLLITIILELLFDAEGRIEVYFVVLAIPILIGYILLMVPNSIPDEIVHFSKTYLTSEFKWGIQPYAEVPSDYYAGIRYNYLQLRELIFKSTDYMSVFRIDTTNYNFIVHVIPSIGFMIGRLFNWSITFSFLLARLFSAMLYVTFGYFSIKKIPFGKWLLLVFMLSPMILQQAGSLSADNVINCVAILSISYCLYIYKKEQSIDYKDIIILSSCLLVIALTKYVYLPVFGVLFISYKKLFEMDKKKWAMVGFVLLIVGCVYYYFNLYLPTISDVPTQVAHEEYLKATGVDGAMQISNLIHNPMSFFTSMINTTNRYGLFYIYSMLTTPLSWLNLEINEFFFYMYSAILAVAILIEDCTVKLKFFFSKLWLLLIGAMIVFAIYVGFYITWTPVNGLYILGIQGRYFIPVGLLLLLLLLGRKKLFLKHPSRVIFTLLLLFQSSIFISIINYFK